MQTNVAIVRSHPTRFQIASALLLTVSAVACLTLLPPDIYRFYPRCPFFQITGLLCPGCGATRALAALLRGDIREAWRQNALVILLLPSSIRLGLMRCFGNPAKLPVGSWVVVATIVGAFGILRNL